MKNKDEKIIREIIKDFLDMQMLSKKKDLSYFSSWKTARMCTQAQQRGNKERGKPRKIVFLPNTRKGRKRIPSVFSGEGTAT